MADLISPHSLAISKFYPSLISDLATCGLRSAFNRDNDFNHLKKRGLKQILGLIRHDVSAKVATGVVNDLEESEVKKAINQLWDDVTKNYATSFQEEWQPYIPPEPERTSPPLRNWAQLISHMEGEHVEPELVCLWPNLEHLCIEFRMLQTLTKLVSFMN